MKTRHFATFRFENWKIKKNERSEGNLQKIGSNKEVFKMIFEYF